MWPRSGTLAASGPFCPSPDAPDSEGDLVCGGWGEEGGDDEGGPGPRAARAGASGGGRGSESGCGSPKYRSTDREASGGVTVQQPLPQSGPSLPGGSSPSPAGSSPPYASSPRPRLDSGLESLGSPGNGTPPRPGSNGSESGFAGVSSPSNGYFSPHNDQGFARWNASPSPETDLRGAEHSRATYQNVPPSRRKDIKWPAQQEKVESGEAALPDYLECFPQAGVEPPPETSWGTCSTSPERGTNSGSRCQDGGGHHFAAEAAYWQHYAYPRHHHHHARSPATPPSQSPDLLPRHSKGKISPSSYTPPCSPVTPEAAVCVHGSYPPTSTLKSRVPEEEEEYALKESETGYVPLREESDEHLNGSGDDLSSESNSIPNSSSEDGVQLERALENGSSSENEEPLVREPKDSSDQFDSYSGDQPDTYAAVSLLSFDVSRLNLSVSTDSEDVKSEDEVAPLHRDGKSCTENAEKMAKGEEVFSADSVEMDMQVLADIMLRKREYVAESPEECSEDVDDKHIPHKSEEENEDEARFELAVGECSPVEGTLDEIELRKKYLDADSSDMDLKAVRIICEEMACRAKIIEGEDAVIACIESEEPTETRQEGSEASVVGAEIGREKKEELQGSEQDDGEIEDRTPRVRRSTSLKTGKTPPGTPSRKKIVRFADVLGLDLADVRTFLDEIPHVPKSAFQDLAPEGGIDPLSAASLPHWSAPADWAQGISPEARVPRRPRRYHLTPLFPQPGAAADFIDRIRERCVCLESAVEEDTADEEDDGVEFYGVNGWSVLGTVRVRNLAFHKTVHARASADGWRSHADVPASYLPGSCDGFSDRFAFELRPGIHPTGGGPQTAPFPRKLPNGGRLEFAVRFQCQGSQYWDNNAGINYVFSVEPCVNAGATAERKPEARPPPTPAPDRSRAAFQYLSLMPSPESDWATFL
ncbi:uncharacterized protein Gbs-76A [Hetaerina americana]|uniref:uncharacterized protein Gbs-76A n=1 Tax=Hetaerina americana TaxID=62018 RepID=UPI003A7F1E53